MANLTPRELDQARENIGRACRSLEYVLDLSRRRVDPDSDLDDALDDGLGSILAALRTATGSTL